MKILNETHGIISDPKIFPYDLIKLITDYIYDAKDGLNSYIDIYPDEEPIITLSILKSYWKYKYGKLFDNSIIPDWIGNFTIIIEEPKQQIYSACYYKSGAINKNTNKLDFKISIVDTSGKDYNRFYKDLVHEFRHAYKYYFQYINKLPNNRKNPDIYNYCINHIKPQMLISTSGMDFVLIQPKIYTEKEYLMNALYCTVYFTDKSEISSYLQEHAVILKMYYEKYYKSISSIIKKYLNAKQKYSIYIDMPFTYYTTIYKTYKVLYDFWNTIDKIDPDLLDTAIEENLWFFKNFLCKNIIDIKIQGDGLILLKKFVNNYKKIIDTVIKKMHQIYYDIIYINNDTEKSYKNIEKELDKKINNDIILDIDIENTINDIINMRKTL